VEVKEPVVIARGLTIRSAERAAVARDFAIIILNPQKLTPLQV
jgi:hypothetical protein